MKRISKNKGITLIALVITIIVLLILAAVSIATLTGENGILTKAGDAKDQTNEAKVKEQVQMEVYGSYDNNGKLDMDKLKENLEKNLGVTDIEDSGTEEDRNLKFKLDGYDVEVDSKGNVTVGGKSEGGGNSEDTTPPTVSHEIKNITEPPAPTEPQTPSGGELCNDGTGKKVPIPSGFSYKEGTVDEGYVITALDGSEFVWVPVPYVVEDEEGGKINGRAEIEIKAEDESGIEKIENITQENIEKNSDTNYTVKANGDYKFKITDKAGNSVEEYTVTVKEINSITEKPIAKEGIDGNGNYQGVLYSFESTGSRENPNEDGKAYGQGTLWYREPSLVTGGCYYDYSDGKDTDTATKALYGENETVEGSEYDAESYYYDTILGYKDVKEFGKEMQEEYNRMVESVKKYKGFYVGRYETSLDGEKVQSKTGKTSMNAADNYQNWYKMYLKQKNYASANGIENIVGSSMIWGSQYDAMLNWMQINGVDVKSREPIEGASSNGTHVTGSESLDKINNVYDLLGCLWEWTLEANLDHNRTQRKLPYLRDTIDSIPNADDDWDGSRLSLYIK